MNVWQTLLNYLFILNILFGIAIVFFQRKEPRSVWGWLLLLYFLPGVGFLFYLLIGSDFHKRKIFKIKEVEDRLSETIRQQEEKIKLGEWEEVPKEMEEYKDLVIYNLETSGAVLTSDNQVEILSDGVEKFTRLVEDIRNAKKFVHVQYYIIRDDVLFTGIKEALIEKAREGVEVRVLFDAMGCRKTKKRLWKELQKEGILTAEFFPAWLGRFQLRMNYRNHRKIVVIDNEVGYVGGFNVGKEYLGIVERFGYWRDTHLRIEGSSVLGLGLRFLLDWNYAAKNQAIGEYQYLTREAEYKAGNSNVQIISSGPDHSEKHIRNNYLHLIHKAKKSIYIQTPYFIPDEAMLDSLIMAQRSGVEVNLMIPCKPDHPFVQWANISYAGDLIMAGANVYTYDKGFLHSKGMIVDDQVLCYGTANMDIRSFALNFEVNAVVYDKEKAEEMVKLWEEDLKDSTLITRDMYASRSMRIRAKEQIYRLFSPLL